ncbi:beta-glucoside-specific PTS transporter subunit IIABC [Companilactobacillus metriopterae]|uniref:beta-glucoside-specific PTS transporter subunit IIABC n=1 Tax=Companilactobacillus metriopterae TaxID=1909267 RepID=UPI00100A8631|nr:beta-glucoside-specific PTS transporter subunit IIABC [Companilactobacillus metriopterae]
MAEKVRDYSKLAKDIYDIVGGDENINNVVHCATRLRLELKNTTPEMKEKVSKLNGVITVVENSGQFQIVIGQHVVDVYDQFIELTDIELNDSGDQPKQSVLNKIIATMSAVFAPFIYVLAAAGILQGILILLNLFISNFAKTGTYQVLSFISWAPFVFLPIFIAITASQHFKTNMFIAVACCAALVSPTWATMAASIASGHTIDFLGIPLTQTVYTSSVLPPLLLVWLLSYLEKFLNKHMPDVIKSLAVPFLCILIMVPLTILLIGPVSQLAANGIANGYNWMVKVAPPLAGAVIGGFWEVFVIFGVHWGITPVVLANFDMYGMDSFQAFQTAAVVSQVGAVLGVFLKTKDKDLKGVSLSAFVTGIFGITEPTIYGVTLKFKKPFVIACVSGAVGGIVMSFFNSHYYAYAGLPGMLTMVNGIGANQASFIGIVIGCAVAFFGAMAMVMFLGTGEKEAIAEGIVEDPEKSEIEENAVNTDPIVVNSPIDGHVLQLSEIDDPVFSSGAMGQGMAFEPTGNKVYSPVDGKIVMFADTKHAVGISGNDGAEVLIHIGMDTVELKGEHYTERAKVGDLVKKGDLLLEFDADAIKDAGYSLVTPMVITNSAEYKDVIVYPVKDVKNGEAVLELNK